MSAHLPLAGARIPARSCSVECRDLLSRILVAHDDAPPASWAGAPGEAPTDQKHRITIKVRLLIYLHPLRCHLHAILAKAAPSSFHPFPLPSPLPRSPCPQEIINHPWFMIQLPPPFDGDPLDPFPRTPDPGPIGPPIPPNAVANEASLQRLVTDATRKPGPNDPKNIVSWKPVRFPACLHTP